MSRFVVQILTCYAQTFDFLFHPINIRYPISSIGSFQPTICVHSARLHLPQCLTYWVGTLTVMTTFWLILWNVCRIFLPPITVLLCPLKMIPLISAGGKCCSVSKNIIVILHKADDWKLSFDSEDQNLVLPRILLSPLFDLTYFWFRNVAGW